MSTVVTRRRRLAEFAGGVREARRMGAHDGWPRDRLLAWQRERLAELHAFAQERSPFYRDRDPGAILDKATLMAHYDEVLTDRRLSLARLEEHLDRLRGDERLDGDYRVMATGGTSGLRAVVPLRREEWRVCLAAFFRMGDLAARRPRPGRRIATLVAVSPRHMSARYAQTADVGLMRVLRLDPARPVDELVPALQAHRPEELYGYPSTVALLAIEQLEGRLDIAPQHVSTSSEVRTAEMERLIVDAWGVQPYDNFALTETGILACDCTHHAGLHPFEDHTVVEVVGDDGAPVADGELGRLVVTPLHFRTLPLLRYEIADLVRATTEPCPCGRPYMRLTEVQGRSDDVLTLPAAHGAGEVLVHPIAVRSPLAAVPGLAQYQVVCRGSALALRVVVRRGADPAVAADAARRGLESSLAQAGARVAEIRVEIVDAIPRSSVGKHRLVVADARAPVGA